MTNVSGPREQSGERAWRLAGAPWIGAALGALAALLYLGTAPAVVNLDGLGYLKLLEHNFAAGHLLYMPLLRTVTWLAHGDGLRAGRVLNALLGGLGVVLVYHIAGALDPRRPTREWLPRATFAAAGLALSYAYWAQAADVETYALAMVALLALVRILLAYDAQPSPGRAAAANA
jgi:hypothetical protein